MTRRDQKQRLGASCYGALYIHSYPHKYPPIEVRGRKISPQAFFGTCATFAIPHAAKLLGTALSPSSGPSRSLLVYCCMSCNTTILCSDEEAVSKCNSLEHEFVSRNSNHEIIISQSGLLSSTAKYQLLGEQDCQHYPDVLVQLISVNSSYHWQWCWVLSSARR